MYQKDGSHLGIIGLVGVSYLTEFFSKVLVNLGVCHNKKLLFPILSFIPKKLCNVLGATSTVLKKLLHPKKVIGDMYAKIGPQDRLNDLVVVRKGTKPIKSNPTTVIFFRHYNFPNNYIYISERY